MLLPMQDVRQEARRLSIDPDHLRRKAAYMREQAALGGPLQEQRLARALELEAAADHFEAARG